MINPWTVLGALRQITALDDNGAASALPLCASAAAEIDGKIKDSAYEDNILVIEAAASIAYHKMILLKAANGDIETSFKAGDISVAHDLKNSLETASQIKESALKNAAPYLNDDGFLFRQVGV